MLKDHYEILKLLVEMAQKVQQDSSTLLSWSIKTLQGYGQLAHLLPLITTETYSPVGNQIVDQVSL